MWNGDNNNPWFPTTPTNTFANGAGFTNNGGNFTNPGGNFTNSGFNGRAATNVADAISLQTQETQRFFVTPSKARDDLERSLAEARSIGVCDAAIKSGLWKGLGNAFPDLDWKEYAKGAARGAKEAYVNTEECHKVIVFPGRKGR